MLPILQDEANGQQDYLILIDDNADPHECNAASDTMIISGAGASRTFRQMNANLSCAALKCFGGTDGRSGHPVSG